MGLLEHWAWIPMAACVAIFCLWLTSCTLAPQTTGSSSPQPTPLPNVLPPVTITVFDTATDTPPPTLKSIVVQLQQEPDGRPDPTPIRYVIEANDTLLQIALNYGIELESLLLANPEVDPRILQIGQELIIPVRDNIPAENMVAPVPLRVAPAGCYPTTSESVICTGFVGNDTIMPVEQVKIEVTILREDSTVIRSTVAIVEQSYIQPGDIAPYRAVFDGVSADELDTVRVRLVAAMETDTITSRYAPILVQDDVLVPEGRRYRFSAMLTNTGERTANPPRVVLTLVDDNDRVFGYRIWEGETPLFAGVPNRVELSLLPITEIPEAANLTYRVHVEARLVE